MMAGPGLRVKKGNRWFEERRGGCKRCAWQLKGTGRSHISGEVSGLPFRVRQSTYLYFL